jgi:hypothetical protein
VRPHTQADLTSVHGHSSSASSLCSSFFFFFVLIHSSNIKNVKTFYGINIYYRNINMDLVLHVITTMYIINITSTTLL